MLLTLIAHLWQVFLPKQAHIMFCQLYNCHCDKLPVSEKFSEIPLLSYKLPYPDFNTSKIICEILIL